MAGTPDWLSIYNTSNIHISAKNEDILILFVSGGSTRFFLSIETVVTALSPHLSYETYLVTSKH